MTVLPRGDDPPFPPAPPPGGMTSAALPQFVAWLDAGPGPHCGPAGPPAWPAQVAWALFAGQEPAAAREWAGRVHERLRRMSGQVPFAVVHDWHATTVLPLLSRSCAGQEQVGALHASALAGATVTRAQWAGALEAALPEVYRRAYAYRDAWQVNYDGALVYGTAHGFGEEGARDYAVYYADLATGANVRAYADANAYASARSWADAFAAADPDGYARTFPYAAVRAYALALASTADPGQPGAARDAQDPAARTAREQAAYARLADGLAASLDRAWSAAQSRRYGP